MSMKNLCVIVWIFGAAFISCIWASENKVDQPPTLHDPLLNCHEEEEACARDKIAFNAISELHAQLDEDKDGEVDPSEADEFVRDELKYTDSFERTNALHKHDKHISKLELWNAWKHSEVYNWTTDMVDYWLIHEVQLQQYAESFKRAQVAGPDMPKLAVSNMKYLSNVLHIKNAVHKQRIILKAIDLILFGPPKSSHNPWKDLSVVITILLLAGGCWYTMVQNRYSRRHIARMNVKLEQLIKAEQSLKELPNKAEETCPEHADGHHTDECRSRKEMTREVERIQDERVQANEEGERLRLAEEELEFRRDLQLDLESEIGVLKRQIGQLQGQLANMPSAGGGMPAYLLPELQLLLQLCCETEKQHLHAKKAAVTSSLNAVKDEHMKLTKKKSGFIGAIRLDVSGNMDHIESKISSAKDAVYDVKRSYTEHQNRWSQVERLLHLPILSNPGVKTIQATLTDLKTCASSANLLHSARIPQSYLRTRGNSFEDLEGTTEPNGSQHSLSNLAGGESRVLKTQTIPSRMNTSFMSSSNDTLDRVEWESTPSPTQRQQEPLAKQDSRTSSTGRTIYNFRSVGMVSRIAVSGSPSLKRQSNIQTRRNVSQTESLDSSAAPSENGMGPDQLAQEIPHLDSRARPVFALEAESHDVTETIAKSTIKETNTSPPPSQVSTKIPSVNTFARARSSHSTVTTSSRVEAAAKTAELPSSPQSKDSQRLFFKMEDSGQRKSQSMSQTDDSRRVNTLQVPITNSDNIQLNISHDKLSIADSVSSTKPSPKIGRKSPSLRSLRLPIFHRSKKSSEKN